MRRRIYCFTLRATDVNRRTINSYSKHNTRLCCISVKGIIEHTSSQNAIPKLYRFLFGTAFPPLPSLLPLNQLCLYEMACIFMYIYAHSIHASYMTLMIMMCIIYPAQNYSTCDVWPPHIQRSVFRVLWRVITECSINTPFTHFWVGIYMCGVFRG